MRIIKTDRGYIDFDHVLAIGPGYQASHGLRGFDIIFMLRDKAMPILYYPEDLGVDAESIPGYTPDKFYLLKEYEEALMKAVEAKRDEYVALWKGEAQVVRTVITYFGKQAHELSVDERGKSMIWAEQEFKDGHITHNQLEQWKATVMGNGYWKLGDQLFCRHGIILYGNECSICEQDRKGGSDA